MYLIRLFSIVFLLIISIYSPYKAFIDHIPVYEDTSQTLNFMAKDFFKEKQISISQETINLLIERSRGDRGNLINELDKIESYMKTRKSISIDEILKLTDLAENYNVTELLDSCLLYTSPSPRD